MISHPCVHMFRHSTKIRCHLNMFILHATRSPLVCEQTHAEVVSSVLNLRVLRVSLSSSTKIYFLEVLLLRKPTPVGSIPAVYLSCLELNQLISLVAEMLEKPISNIYWLADLKLIQESGDCV